MSTISQVYNHTLLEGGGWGWVFCENQHFCHTILTFWPDFYYFHGEFWHSKMLRCTLFWGVGGGGGGLRKCIVCTLVKMLTFIDGP